MVRKYVINIESNENAKPMAVISQYGVSVAISVAKWHVAAFNVASENGEMKIMCN